MLPSRIQTALVTATCLVLATCGGDDGDDGQDVTVLHETCGPATCADPPSCASDEVLSCCTCIKPPVQEAVVTTCDYIGEYCADSTTPPDVSCLMEGGYPPAPCESGCDTMTLHGVVDVYATGGDSDGVLVEVHRLDADGRPDALVGSSVSALECDAHVADFPDFFESEDEQADCPGPCLEKVSEEEDNHDCRTLGYYAIADVPLNVPLVVKTSQDGGGSLWKDMMSFNIWFFDDEVGADGGAAGHVFYKARCLSTDDWRNIPVAAGDTSGIASGYAAVAGEIHDCSDHRLAFAMVGVYPEGNTLAYFNGVEEHLYPDLSRRPYGTNIDGLYAAIEIEPSSAGVPVWVSSLAQIGDDVISLGWQKAFVYPETLTSVTLRGTRPDQVH